MPDDFKVNPGAVEAVAVHPTNPDKVGLLVAPWAVNLVWLVSRPTVSLSKLLFFMLVHFQHSLCEKQNKSKICDMDDICVFMGIEKNCLWILEFPKVNRWCGIDIKVCLQQIFVVVL